MGRVPQTEVIRYWLDDETDQDTAHLETEEELYQELRRHQGGPTSIFKNHEIEWELIELPENEFRNLRIVKGPPDNDWRTFLPDDRGPAPRLAAIARRIRTVDRPEGLPEDAASKVPKVRDLQDAYQSGSRLGRLILLQEASWSVPWIADGNHRAAAIMLALLDGASYRPQEAYLGRTG